VLFSAVLALSGSYTIGYCSLAVLTTAAGLWLLRPAPLAAASRAGSP
jgi:hypothetical protein